MTALKHVDNFQAPEEKGPNKQENENHGDATAETRKSLQQSKSE